MKLVSMTRYGENNIDYVWIENHYDTHLSGLCRRHNELCYFETDPQTEIRSVYKLTFQERLKFFIKRKLFEWCVGYHWTYPQYKNGVDFNIRRPKWFWGWVSKMYYKF